MKRILIFSFVSWHALAIYLTLATNALAQPLLLEHPRRIGTSDLEFEVSGPGGIKRIEVSTNMIQWTTDRVLASPSGTVRLPVGASPLFVRASLEDAVSGDFPVTITDLTSTSLTLRWERGENATATRVSLAAEPHNSPVVRLLASFDGTVTSYDVTNLASAVDCFFRIEIETPTGTKASWIHARTVGGPRAVLQTRVREVHGFAPTILCITLVNGETDSLNDGWSVGRENGDPIPITAVYRHSVPVSTSDYPVSWHCCGTEAVTEVDHRIFLVLGEAIGNEAILEITGPEGLQFTLPFSDRYLETPVIQLNQVGYNPRATQRWAYVSGWMGDGGGLDLADFPEQVEVLAESENASEPRPVRLAGLPLAIRSALDPMAGAAVREINLAALPPSETAHYRIRIPGVGVSWRTTVSEKAAFKAFYTVARGLYHNRWGGDLRPDLTEWSRPPDHLFVYTQESTNWSGNLDGSFPFEMNTPKVGKRPLAGGHHDAGDFDIRPMHTYVAQMLLRAYEIEPAAFVDGQLNLPESGNAIPDLLDEALWSIAAWEQLQEDDGGVRLGVESYRHPNNQGILADQDRDEDDEPLPYWTYGRDANHSARCAGLFAQAARLVRGFDSVRAEGLKERALKAWQYATNNNAETALRLYPAGELYRLTGEANWRTTFDAVWRSLGATDDEVASRINSKRLDPADYAQTSAFDPDHVLAYVAAVSATDSKAALLRNRFHGYALSQAAFDEDEDREAHRNPHPWNYGVGFGQSTSVGTYFWFVYSALQLNVLTATERQKVFDGMSLGADYVLGGNPNGLVYITGLGTRRILEPLHLDSLAFIKLGRGPIPGIPVYGPVDGRENNGYAAHVMAAFYPEIGDDASGNDRTQPATSGHPVARRHGDVRLWVKANEFSVAEMQAPHAQLFALLMMGTHGAMPPPSYRPGGRDHHNPLP